MGSSVGAILVGIAALLWASDGLVRYPLIQQGFDPIWLVLIDHAICLSIVGPIAFLKYRRSLFQMKPAQWAALFFIGGGASALATILFTASFKYVNPSVAILLQKLQPLFVVLLAMIFLGERPKRAFWFWGFVALLAGLAISFPAFDFAFAQEINLQSKGALLALSAAFIWGLGTVIGKGMLRTMDPLMLTTWRYGFGFFTLLWMVLITSSSLPPMSTDPAVLRSIGYISIVAGLFAMLTYYSGMRRTTATTVTFMELIFPVSAVILNTVFLKTPLSGMQAVAGLVLLFAVTQISVAGSDEGEI